MMNSSIMSAILKSRYNNEYSFFREKADDSTEMKVFKVIIQDDKDHLQLLKKFAVNDIFSDRITRYIRAALVSPDPAA